MIFAEMKLKPNTFNLALYIF